MFLWHDESEKKTKFQFIPILRFCYIAVLKEFLSTIIYVKIVLISHWNDFSLIPLGNVILRGEQDEKNKNLRANPI